MTRAVVLSAVRTPVGRYGGGLADVRPDDLAALAVAAAVDRAGVPRKEIEDVWLGCANQAGEDNRNVARFAALLAGLPDSVAGVTVNRLCASGLAAEAYWPQTNGIGATFARSDWSQKPLASPSETESHESIVVGPLSGAVSAVVSIRP